MEFLKDRNKLPGGAREFIEGCLALPMSLDLPKSPGRLAETALASFVAKDAAVDRLAAILVRELQPALQEADRKVGEGIVAGKKVLKLKLGEFWTLAHKEAGYTHGTLETPKGMKARAELLQKMGEFFTKNASWQNEELGVKGDLFLASAGALSQALNAMEAHTVAHKKLVKERNAAEVQLRRRLRSLYGEVSQVLAKDDVLWGTLGVDSPAQARAKQATRSEQKKVKAEADASKLKAGKLDVIQRKVQAARIKSEKARAKSERLLVTASIAQKLANDAAAEVARLEAEYENHGGSRLTLVALPTRETKRSLSVVSEESALVA